MKNENGITLIALIITIIILAILAAVSVRAVYEMGIVNHAVNGTQKYASEAVKENQMLDSTGSLIENTVGKIGEILGNGSGNDNDNNNNSNQTIVSQVATDGSMYGYSVTNYSANGVTDWSVLYNDDTNVWIVSDVGITGDLSSYSTEADAVAYLENSTEWTDFVDEGINGALAYGGPTLSMMVDSFNAKYDKELSETDDDLYLITRIKRGS